MTGVPSWHTVGTDNSVLAPPHVAPKSWKQEEHKLTGPAFRAKTTLEMLMGRGPKEGLPSDSLS